MHRPTSGQSLASQAGSAPAPRGTEARPPPGRDSGTKSSPAPGGGASLAPWAASNPTCSTGAARRPHVVQKRAPAANGVPQSLHLAAVSPVEEVPAPRSPMPASSPSPSRRRVTIHPLLRSTPRNVGAARSRGGPPRRRRMPTTAVAGYSCRHNGVFVASTVLWSGPPARRLYRSSRRSGGSRHSTLSRASTT